MFSIMHNFVTFYAKIEVEIRYAFNPDLNHLLCARTASGIYPGMGLGDQGVKV